MKRWIPALILALCLLFAGSLALGETLCSGTCGTGMTWELRRDGDGLITLEISGKGAVTEVNWNQYDEDGRPYRADRLVLNEGITAIPDSAFTSILQPGISLTMPSTLKHIGAYAFYGTFPVTLTLNEGLLSIGERAFDQDHCCPTVIVPRTLTDIGFRGLPAGAALWVYPGSEGEQWCEDWGVEYRLINGSMTAREASLKRLLDAISAADDVPMRYRQPAIETLLSMNTLTEGQLDGLTDYVKTEYAALRLAMSDNDLSWGEIAEFAQSFARKMQDIGVEATWWIYYIGDYPGVRLTVTINGESRQILVYRNQGYWYLSRLPQGTSNRYSWRETDEGLILNGYSGSEPNLTVPASLNGKPVVGVENGSWPSGLVNLDLPEGLKFIGQHAFLGLSKLTNVALPDSLECIHDGAFNDCPKIQNVDFGPNLRVLGNAFVGEGELPSVYLPASLEALGRKFRTLTIDPANTHFTKQDGALYNEESDTLLYTWEDEIPENFAVKSGTRYIRDDAFFDNQRLKTVTFPASLIGIGEFAFEGCRNLMTAKLPDGLERIGYGAFQFCEKLSVLPLPSALVELGFNALNQTALGSITIPAGLFTDPDDVYNVQYMIQNDLPSLYYIDVAEGHPRFTAQNGMLFDRSGHTLLRAPLNIVGSSYVPSGTWVIGEKAFENCANLTDLSIPEGVTEIGGDALSGTGIVNLNFPGTVSVIKWQQNMSGLQEIRIPGAVKEMGDFMNSGGPSTVVYGVAGTPAQTLAENHGWTFVPLGGTGIHGFQMMADGRPVASLTIWQGDVVEVTADNDADSDAVKWTFGDRKVAQILRREGATILIGGGAPGTTTHTVCAADDPGVRCELQVTVKPLSSAAPNAAMLPASLKTIETGAFRGAKYRYVYIPDGATSIGSRAFADCPDLRVVRLPDSMKSIALDAFKGCTDLVLLCGETSIVPYDLWNQPNIGVISWQSEYIYAPPWYID